MIWTMLGVLVGVAGAFCIVASELLRAFPKLDDWRTLLAAIFAALGIGVWLMGKFRGHPASEPGAEKLGSSPLGSAFWGAILLVCAGVVLFIEPLRRSPVISIPPLAIAQIVPTNTPVPQPTPPPPAPKPPVVFPALKIQGCILVDGNPVVLIGGETYAVGDRMQGWTVKSVRREGVLMEWDGATKLYKID